MNEPHAMRIYVPKWCTCRHSLRSNVTGCQRGLRNNVIASQHAKSVPTSHFYIPACESNKRANVPYDVPVF